MGFIKKTVKYLRYIFILFLILLVTPEIVHSSTKRVPHSYKQETSDGKYVFVMLAPNKKTDGLGLSPENRERSLELRGQYHSSGLYSVDDSANPLWTVDWYSFRVFFSPDGKYLAKVGLDYSYSTDEAISFYETNNLTKTYKISDILDVAPILPSSFLIDWESEIFINEEQNTLIVKTLTYDTLVFDIKTGEEINSIRPIRFFIFGILGFTIAMILLYLRNGKIKVWKK